MKYYLLYDPRVSDPYCLVSSTPNRTDWATSPLHLFQNPYFVGAWHRTGLSESLEESFKLQGCQILASFETLPSIHYIKTNYPEILL